jgi:flagellar FliL protein
MTAADTPAPGKTKGSKLPLILGLALAVMGGAGGYFVVQGGYLPFGGGAESPAMASGTVEEPLPELSPLGFVPLPPLVVNLPGDEERFLRFVGQLEVAPEHAGDVEALVPRVVDVLNGFLRAVEPREVQDPTALLRLRAQMLRRVQVVAGGDRVRDLLVMEFVVN